MNKKDALYTVSNEMGKTPKGYEWGVVGTGGKELDFFEITICLIKKE
jgi:hypothetical protein